MSRVVEPEAAVFGLFGDRIDVVGLALHPPGFGDALDLLVADERAVDAADRIGVRLVEHVALAQQLLGALFAQDRAAVDPAGDRKAHPSRQVGLDHPGDDVDRGALGGHDQVDARGAAFLAKALDQHLDLLAEDHHQVGQFVDDQHDLRQRRIVELAVLVELLARIGIEPHLDAAAERLALGGGRPRTLSLNPPRLRTPISLIIR